MDPLLRKLNHKGDVPVAVLGAPEEFHPTLEAWRAEGVTVRAGIGTSEAFVLAFLGSRADLAEHGGAVARSIDGDGTLWVAYPKKSSKRFRSDLSRDDAWAPLGEQGFEPVRQVAVDEDWSALRFRRVEFIASMTRAGAISEAGRQRIGEA